MKLALDRRIAAPLLSFIVLSIACGPVEEPPPGDDDDDDEQPAPNGETCAQAIPIQAGTPVSGDLTAAASDQKGAGGSCFELSTDGADLVYSLTLDVEAGVRVVATPSGGADLTLHMYDDVLCDAEHQLVGACADLTFDDEAEELQFPLLPVGTYFIVVDSYVGNDGELGAGPFTLDVSVIPGGQCVPDELEDPNAPNNASNEGASDFSYAGTLCDGDIDGFVIGHIGGSLVIETEVSDPSVRFAVLDLIESDGATPGSTALEIGAEVDASDFANGVAPGFFLLSFVSDPPGGAFTYSLSVEHGCEPDFFDNPYPPADELGNFRTVYGSDVDLVARRTCPEDTDRLHIRFVEAGEAVLSIEGGADLDITATFDDGGGAAPATVNQVVSGGDRTVSFTAAGAGDLVLTIVAAPGAGQVEYHPLLDMSVPPPVNDTCAGRTPVIVDGPPVLGQTFSATHDFVSACSSEDPALDAECNDVFHSLSLAAPTNVEIVFQNVTPEFDGVVSLAELPGGVCPDDVNTLEPVGGVCQADQVFTLQYQLPAGEYVIIVDGEAFDFLGLSEREAGEYSLQVRSFELSGNCAAADAIAVPDATPVTRTLAAADLEANEFETYQCGVGLAGEQIYAVTAGIAGTLRVSVTEFHLVELNRACAQSSDEASCGFLNDEESGSFAELPVAAGETIFAFVEDILEDGAARTVTFEILP